MMNLDISNDKRKQRVYAIMYLKRMFSLRQMDLDYSLSQMIQLCISPSKVYKMTSWRKQTKNQWARDDPSFIIISLFFIATISIAYTIAFRPLVPLYYLKGLIQSVLYTLVIGLAIATALWYFVNHYQRNQRPHSPEQFVEWLYAVDIHFNSLIPVILIGGVLQYIFLPMLMKPGWLSIIFSDFLVLACIVTYCFVTFLGYMYQPFLKMPYFILGIGLVLSICVLIMIACGVNFTQFWISRYFSLEN